MEKYLNACLASINPRLVGDPVDTFTGAVFDRKLEFRLTGPLELWWLRHYDSSQCGRPLALGWGQTHDFDRVLRFGGDGVTYQAPVGGEFLFPHLVEDGDEAALHGFVLRRLSSRRYHLFAHGEAAMEFDFSPSAQVSRLTRLFRGSHQIQLLYNASHQLERIIDSVGRQIRVIEEPSGRVLSLTMEGWRGNPELSLVTYAYDQVGNLVGARTGSGHGYTFAYDSANRMILRTGRKGFKFRFAYDEQGRCIKSTGDNDLLSVTLDYKVPGRVTQVKRVDGGLWTYFFDPFGGLTEIRDPLGGSRKFLRDETGKITTELDPNEGATHFFYDRGGAQVGKIDSLGNARTLPENPGASALHSERVAANSAEYEFGRLLDLTQIILPDQEQARALPLSPDAKKLLFTRSDRPAGSMGEDQFRVLPLGALWWPPPRRGRLFNVLGKLVQQNDEYGRSRHWDYDAAGNVSDYVDFDGGAWAYDYGTWHFLQGLTNPLGDQVRFSYTATGEIASCTDPGGTLSEYRYDFNDHLIAVERHGAVRETYTRDPVGNLLAKHAGDGRELLKFEIGPGNLRIKRTLASGDEHTFQYDKSGRCLIAATKRDSVEFAYDSLGNRLLEKRNGQGVELDFQGLYRPARSLFLGRFATLYEWTWEGVLKVIDPGGSVHRIRFHRHGLIERTFSNGTIEVIQYDGAGRCLAKSTQRVADRAWNRRYHWSGEGELRQVQDSNRGEVRHEYDAAHRLRRRIVDGRTEEFEFDKSGTLILQPGLHHVTLQSGNRLEAVNGLNVVYNDRNHVAERQTMAGPLYYTYDSRDQLLRVDTPHGQWKAEYDAFGRRIRKTWAGQTTEFFWNNEQLISELKPDGRLRLYIYADPLALSPLLFLDYDSVSASPESCRRYFVFTDQIGTPCLIEDEKGLEVWRARIEPFGRTEIAPKAKVEFNLRFPGHYLDAEIGLHYNRFRYYDPSLGCYLQSDPWGIAGGYNVYAYRSNPLLEVDVRGLGEEGTPNSRRPDDDEEGTRPPTPNEDEELPPGVKRDVNGRLRGPDGRYWRDPNEPPGAHNRAEYPSGYRQGTHDEMAARWTDEGQEQGGVPVDANGNRIPRDQLTWRDANGRQIPPDELTYDHDPPVVERWNNGGNNTSRADRADDYNDPDQLTPMGRSENSSHGAKLGQTYTQQTGPNYTR